MSPLRLGRTLTLVALLGLILTSLLVALMRGPGDVLPAIGSFASGVGGSPTAIGATVQALVPILMIGLAACIAFRASLFDIGQVGQFLFGGVCAGAVAPLMPGPGIVIMLASLLAGVAGGAVWSTLVARFAEITGKNLVILSLIANYMAVGLAGLVTRTLLQDPGYYNVTATRPVPQQAWLPILLPNTSLHAGILLALFALVITWIVLNRTAIGHRLIMFGRNPLAASLAGVQERQFKARVLAVTGAICGLAGAVEVLGVYHGYQEGTLGGSGSIAWTGLTAAMLVPSGLLALLPVSLLLAALSTGFEGIQRELGISSGLSTLLAGIVIVTAAFATRSPASPMRRRRPPRGEPAQPAPAAKRSALSRPRTLATARLPERVKASRLLTPASALLRGGRR